MPHRTLRIPAPNHSLRVIQESMSLKYEPPQLKAQGPSRNDSKEEEEDSLRAGAHLLGCTFGCTGVPRS